MHKSHKEPLRVNRKEKGIILKWQIISILGLNVAYLFVISEAFDYYGYFDNDFNLTKIMVSSLLIIILLFIGYFVDKPYFNTTWNIIFLYLLCSEVIYYQYNQNTQMYQIISITVILILIAILSKINVSFKGVLIKDNTEKPLGIISFVMFLPFLVLYFRDINLENLLLVDIYETRSKFSAIDTGITGYLKAPLTRIILPILIIWKIEKRQFIMVAIYSLMIVYIFLTGAIKSILLGLVVLFIFYKGSYVKKTLLFLRGISALTILGTILYYISGNIFFLDTFVRRVFFVPPYLGNLYYDLFHNNLTYLSHSPLGFGIVDSKFNDISITRYVGELTGVSTNPNVGVITEGIFSFGIYGGLFAALLVALFIWFLGFIKIDKRFFGIVFMYIYYLNTSLLSILLVTHGLAFFLIFAVLFLRDRGKYDKKLY